MQFRRTTWLIWGMGGFLLGLVLSHSGVALQTEWLWLSMALAAVTSRYFKFVSLIAILFFGLSAGWLRGASYFRQLEQYKNYFGGQVVIVGRAATDGIYGDKSQLNFDLDSIEIVKPNNLKLPGRISVLGFGEPSVLRGDVVQVEGKLLPTIGSKQAKISFADLKVLGQSSSAIETARRNFIAGMETNLPEPAASFGLGLLIGQRSTLPKTILTMLSAVGLTHIVAVSGYNLTILVAAARRLFGKRSKYQTLIGSLLLIGLFLLVTGLSASIVRASIVSLLTILAWYYGREFRPVLLILLAAAVTAGWQPIYIWSDVGWYLSFAAFYGVLVLAPLVTKRILAGKQPKALTYLIIESLCAWVMTAPIILFVFRELSLVAIISNVLIVPLVPLAMLASLVAGLSGMLTWALAAWLALPARLILTYMLDVVTVLSRLPHALAKYSLRTWQLASLYGLISGWCLILWHKVKSTKEAL